MDLNNAVELVAQLHRHIGAPVSKRPILLRRQPQEAARLATQILELNLVATSIGAEHQDQLLLRVDVTLEELAEWSYAHARSDLMMAADAWADGLYVWLGHAVASGLPADALFQAIRASNMTKDARHLSWPGKAVKGLGYKPPDVRSLLPLLRLHS